MSITNNPIIGKGTTMTFTNSAVTGSPVTVAKINSIKIPPITVKDVEITGMDSTIEDFMPGFTNAGEAEFDITYLGTQSNALKAFVGIPGTTFTITRTNGAVNTFTGYVNMFGDEIPLKEKATNKIKVRATSLNADA